VYKRQVLIGVTPNLQAAHMKIYGSSAMPLTSATKLVTVQWLLLLPPV
jgi:hypothetical protein